MILFQSCINMLLRKQKFYEGIKNPILIRIFGNKSWSDHVTSRLYFCGINLDKMFSNLKQDMPKIHELFVYNFNYNFNLLFWKHRLTYISNRWYNHKISLSVTLFGITIDWKLNFREHINNIVKKHIIN